MIYILGPWKILKTKEKKEKAHARPVKFETELVRMISQKLRLLCLTPLLIKTAPFLVSFHGNSKTKATKP